MGSNCKLSQIFGKTRESLCCGYRGGLVFEAHGLLYHSTFKAQGPSRTCNESKEWYPGEKNQCPPRGGGNCHLQCTQIQRNVLKIQINLITLQCTQIQRMYSNPKNDLSVLKSKETWGRCGSGGMVYGIYIYRYRVYIYTSTIYGVEYIYIPPQFIKASPPSTAWRYGVGCRVQGVGCGVQGVGYRV